MQFIGQNVNYQLIERTIIIWIINCIGIVRMRTTKDAFGFISKCYGGEKPLAGSK